MKHHKAVVELALVLACALLTTDRAAAQITGIAGVVKDTSGAVLPGVTVEASSPVLIEKVRSTATDEQGLYRIVDLRPGVYSVTFALTGFTTVKREGVALTGSFTATVNAELGVGAIQETVTVSGATATVDIHNVVQQKVLSDTVRQMLPSARSVQTMAATIPGIVNTGGDRPSPQDVGGLTGERGQLLIHGSRSQDFTIQIDGSSLYNSAGAGAAQSYTFNPAEALEYVYEVGAVSAAYLTGGVRANVIPKEGGNRFSGFFLGSYTNGSLQSYNLTDELKAQGLLTPNKVNAVWDYNPAGGGPLKQDKLWFFASYRDWGNGERVAGMFRMIDPAAFTFNPKLGVAGNADPNQPVDNRNWSKSYSGRLTWQANAKNKFSLYAAHQPRAKIGAGVTGSVSYEAGNYSDAPINRLITATWKVPATSRVFFEASWASPLALIPTHPTTEFGLNFAPVQVVDSGTGLTFRASASYNRPLYATPTVQAAVSYVTGAHALKVGGEYGWGFAFYQDQYVNQGMTYTLRNGVAQQINLVLSPRNEREDFRNLGLYAQEQWTLRRLTVNAGLRFDYLKDWIPVQKSGPGPFVPAQTWPALENVPNWKDVSPRLGASYNLFGDSKTAVKATLNRYVVRDITALARQANPLLFNATATRQWNDANGDYIPQESELQGLSNSAFGTAATTTFIDEDVRTGWSVRPYNWEATVSVQQEVVPQVTANVAYARRSYGNFTVTDNLALVPADYDPYCITPPTDAKRAGVGGTQICGLYDLNPAKRSVTPNNLVTFADKYGKRRETYNGIDVGLNVRLPHRVQLTGGLSTGTNSGSVNSSESCFVVDSPQSMRFCKVNYPWLTGVKMLGTVGLPWGVDAAATFQTTPGAEIGASYAVTNAAVTGLGRPLTFTSSVPLIEPGTVFDRRLYQLDFRVNKNIQVRGVRARFILDVGNALNANPVLVRNLTYGTNWLVPTYILPGRLIKPTFQIDF